MYALGMSTQHSPAIVRLVEHHGGPTKVAQMLGGDFPYQQVQLWKKRGWASPMHIMSLEPLLLEGMTIRDLHADRDAAKEVSA